MSTPTLSQSIAPPEQEIRFAVVMYGGVSLAIYMHGVAQELLRLVRSTSGADLGDDEVAQIYRDLSREVRSIAETGSGGSDETTHEASGHDRRPTRFTVDILSGTSAGGINAVFLAKALAARSQGLGQLRKTWIESADMKELLRKAGVFDPQRSLLDGQWMYGLLYEAFRGINDELKDQNPDYHQVEQLDVFVTTTDLNGVEMPIGLANQEVPERVHKGLFHFQFESVQVPQTKERDDFTRDFDAMLAFASRCTSSFPIAFAPMKLENIKGKLKEDYTPLPERYKRFFTWVRKDELNRVEGIGIPFDQRELADGGYLDNKPFGPVIKALSYRPTHLPHARKLLYVDPFPENAAARQEQAHFNFAENALAAGFDLPRYETIRDDIDRIKDANRTQERLRYLRNLAYAALDQANRSKYGETRTPALFGEAKLSSLVEKYGPGYATYHGIRLFGVSDDVARIIASIGGSGADDGLFLAIRFVVRHWRTLKYDAEGAGGKFPENEFLTDFDFAFRLRRLASLIEWAQQNHFPFLVKQLLMQLVRINRKRDLLRRSDARDANHPEYGNALLAPLDKLRDIIHWTDLQRILDPAVEKERRVQAAAVYNEILAKSKERNFHVSPLDELVEAMRAQWTSVFTQNRKDLNALRSLYPGLNKQYEAFDMQDLVSLAFLEGSDVREHTDTEIFRISPAGGIQRAPEQKLAGYNLMAFGAFLDRSWRENDLLWGRLDASEQLVNAILPHKDDEEPRRRFIGQLRSAIVRQEKALRLASDSSLDPVLRADTEGCLEQFLQHCYEMPAAPLPGKSSRQAALATDLLGRMIEEDVGAKGKPASALQFIGGGAALLIGFLTPGTLARVFWNYWLTLVLVMCFLILAVGNWLNDPSLSRMGAYGTAAGLLLWLLSFTLGDVLAGKMWPVWVVRYVKWIVLAAVAVLVAIGWVRFPAVWSGTFLPLLRDWTDRLGLLWELHGGRYLKYAAIALAGFLALIGLTHARETWISLKRRMLG